MKFKSMMCLVFVLILSLGVLAGCGGNTDGQDAAAPSAENPSESQGSAEQPAENETSASEEPWAGKRIGVANISLYDEWCAAVRDEFVAQAEALGFAECNVQDGNLNAETQQRQVEDFITKQYDVICLDAVSSEGIVPTLEQAGAAGIPVVAFDSSATYSDLVSYIAWDHGMTGELTAEYVANYAQETLGGKIDVAILSMTTAPHTAIRSEKFKEKLISLMGEENVNIVFEQDFGETRDSAANIVANNIEKKVDIIWCAVDNAAFGARAALEAKGVEGTKIVSAGAWGAEPFNALNDKDPYYMMCVGVSPANIVKDTLQIVCDYFAGKTDIPERHDIELSVIDQSNVSEFMKYVKE